MDTKKTDNGWTTSARSKTVATLGPVSFPQEMMEALIVAGVDVFRLNMAHGSREVHQQAVADIRAASQNVNHEVGILVDLAGPKIRIGQMASEPITIETGATIRFVKEPTDNPLDLTCSYDRLVDDVAVGDSIMLCDGTIRTIVQSKDDSQVTCQVVDGGELRSRQGVNLPGANLSVSALGDVDRDNARWAVGAGADFISLSFVRTEDEIHELKQLVREAEGGNPLVIAKIEKPEALENIESIVKASDGIMVARGDLGVEIDIEKTPLAQKKIIRTCQQFGKPVIVATQMLESMRYSKTPTRAEASDVANAILDGADACMLSGETAIGEFPIDAVQVMQRIMTHTEQHLRHRPSRWFDESEDQKIRVSQAVIRSAASVAQNIDAGLVAIATGNGDAALLKSKQRDFIPTVAFSHQLEIIRRMNLFWGIKPVFLEVAVADQDLVAVAQEWAKENFDLSEGDRIVFVVDTEAWPGVNDMLLVSEVH